MTSNAQVTLIKKNENEMQIESELAENASGKVKDSNTKDFGKANDNQYFFEDEIFRIDNKGRVKFGLVIETPDTYSGDEDDDYDDVLNKDEVRVVWYPEGREHVQSENTIALADRTLMPGDVVRRLVLGKDTQRGYCREINMCADVKVLGKKYVIKNVMAERLCVISNWQRDNAVCMDSWVGSIKEVEEKAVLRSCYGARIEISSNEFYVFKDSSSRQLHPYVFYPGNTVVGRLPSIDRIKMLTPNIPIHTNKKGKPITDKYTIEYIYTDSVWVHWQCKALSDDANTQINVLEHPKTCVTGDDLKRLKRLNLFESCMLQINDRNYLKFSQYDTIVKKSDWDKEQSKKFKLFLNEQQKEDNKNLFVPNCGGANTYNFEKCKKKLNLLDADKSGKSKKFLMKMEKLNQSLSKEKSQINENNKDDINVSNSAVVLESTDTGWVTDGDDDCEEDYKHDKFQISAPDFNEDEESTTSTISTSSNPSPHWSPKHSELKNTATQNLNIPSQTPLSETVFKDGEELVTEALYVYSTATVVWQDGTIEKSIRSTQLYPIHHLDNHEFFPGDFVISSKEDSDVAFRDYGVIQTVDHDGRTAHVKWFTTYTSTEDPKPAYNGETEVSVYDLKDHPDFQYRPGTMVIRVANFVGEDATCTAGQIIDNYIDGHVKVWWVDGHISMCWPQDLFEVGQYDHGDWGQESEDSWETESEDSEFGGESSPKLALEDSHVIINIERAIELIARLEEIFNACPKLLDPEVMRKLLTVFKGCRYLDRLLNTNFFHEENFKGLIERKEDSQIISERVQDRKNRLFNHIASSSHQQCHYQAIIAVNTAHSKSNIATNNSGKEYLPKVVFNFSSMPIKGTTSSSAPVNSNGAVNRSFSPSTCKSKCTLITDVQSDNANDKSDEFGESRPHNLLTTQRVPNTSTVTNLPTDCHPSKMITSLNTIDNYEKNQLLNSTISNIKKVNEGMHQIKWTKNSHSQDDWGSSSRSENCDSSCNRYANSSNLSNSSLNKVTEEQMSMSCSNIEIPEGTPSELACVRLCSLLKIQLEKCIAEIRRKYHKADFTLQDSFIYNAIEEKTEEESTNNADTEVVKEICVLSETVPISENQYSKSSLKYVVSPSTCPSAISSEHFQVLPTVHKLQKYHSTIFQPNNPQQYYRAVLREHRMLKNSLPPGVWVRVFEDRIDLLSVMIEGPKKTPYENGMLFFDIQLGRNYPKDPPLCHYISYCSDRLNPNLYEDGKVCVSLLGTWSGRDSEVWNATSTLLQVIVSIQGLILVSEPYFNEAGYEKQKGTQQGEENSRMYNEMVLIKLVQATTRLLSQPPIIFVSEVLEYYKSNGYPMYSRIKAWMELSNSMPNLENEEDTDKTSQCSLPEFPLVPASRGFCITLAGVLQAFKSKLSILYATNEFLDSSNASENNA